MRTSILLHVPLSSPLHSDMQNSPPEISGRWNFRFIEIHIAISTFQPRSPLPFLFLSSNPWQTSRISVYIQNERARVHAFLAKIFRAAPPTLRGRNCPCEFSAAILQYVSVAQRNDLSPLSAFLSLSFPSKELRFNPRWKLDPSKDWLKNFSFPKLFLVSLLIRKSLQTVKFTNTV